jgi:hypothetical protein
MRKRVGRPKRCEVTESDIHGLKYFDKLAPLLERLHEDGCERDQASKRVLHYDQCWMLILLYLFFVSRVALRCAHLYARCHLPLSKRRVPATPSLKLLRPGHFWQFLIQLSAKSSRPAGPTARRRPPRTVIQSLIVISVPNSIVPVPVLLELLSRIRWWQW